MPALGNALGLPFQRRGASFVGPLDTLSTGIVGAWSVARRLLTSYTGPWLRVRRSSDNAEQDCTTVASILAFCGAGNGFVVTIYDQTGLVDDLTQSACPVRVSRMSARPRVTANPQPLPPTIYFVRDSEKK